tara:strand:+ start:2258 stop:2596 length:339 start_codon:yes stop_codon:yes gene_type:complete
MTLNLNTLTQQLDQAKKELKLYNAAELVVEAFKAEHTYTLSGNVTDLFTKKELFSCGRLNVKAKDVTHNMFMNNDKDNKDLKKLVKALKFLAENDASERMVDMVAEDTKLFN